MVVIGLPDGRVAGTDGHDEPNCRPCAGHPSRRVAARHACHADDRTVQAGIHLGYRWNP